MLDVFKKENGKIVIYTKKLATDYISDFVAQMKEFGNDVNWLYADSCNEAIQMGKSNLFALMEDFYNYPIIPIWNLQEEN